MSILLIVAIMNARFRLAHLIFLRVLRGLERPLACIGGAKRWLHASIVQNGSDPDS